MSKKVLMIDDLKDPEQLTKPEEEVTVARTFDEGMIALKEQGPWDLLLLDNDLGDPRYEYSGNKILDWIEENPEYMPTDIRIISHNPVARANMERILIRMLRRMP